MEENLKHPDHPKYEPGKWNNKFVKKSHNCYAYAMNTIKQKYVEDCINYKKNQ